MAALEILTLLAPPGAGLLLWLAGHHATRNVAPAAARGGC